MSTPLKKIALLFCFGFLVISCKNEKYINTKIIAKTIAVDSTFTSNQKITETIAPYKEKMVAEISTVLSYTPKDIVRTDGALESSLGNLLADLSYERANPIFFKKTGKNIDFALFNYGGIRAGITAGNITNKNAFELMPFENNFVITELSGEKIMELVQYLIKNNKAHPVSKHLRLSLKKNGYQLKIHQKPFQKNKTYLVLTTNYLQSGGDNMLFFKNPIKLYTLTYKMRHAIIDYFKSKDTIESRLDGRFKRN